MACKYTKQSSESRHAFGDDTMVTTKQAYTFMLFTGGIHMTTASITSKQLSQNMQHLDALLTQVADGNQEAFHTLYQETSHSIYIFLLSLLQNKEDAEDILQETYIRIGLHANSYQSKNKSMAWMYTIARNLAYMRLREAKKTSFTDIEQLDLVAEFSHISNLEDRMVLQTAFTILSQEERTIVLLHASQGMKHREIGMILHMALPTVLSKYRRAIKKLQVALKDYRKE